MTYILIMALSITFKGTSVSSATFYTEKNCEEAKVKFIKAFDSTLLLTTARAVCVKK